MRKLVRLNWDWLRVSFAAMMLVLYGVSGLWFMFGAPLPVKAESNTLPPLVLEPTELDFCSIWADEIQTKDVRVKNSGTAVVVVSGVTSSCPCTVAELKEREIAPGQKVTLKVKLDASEYSTNSVNTKVYLDFQGGKERRMELPVHATLKAEYTVEPEPLNFGKVKKGSSPKRSLILHPTGHIPITLVHVEVPKELAVAQETLQNGDYRIDVTISPEVAVGRFNNRIRLVTNLKRLPKRDVAVSAEIVGIECAITPRVVVFGPSAPGTGIGSIELQDSDDFRVLKAFSTVEGIDCNVKEIQKDRKYRVELSLRNDIVPGRKVGKVKVEVQEGSLVEEREVAIYGEVKP